MKELDLVALTRSIAEHSLQPGDVGTVVHRHCEGHAFEVEFVTATGMTVAVLTLEPADIQPVGDREILHVRELAAAPA